ncbi:uncharacterized protein FIBRA_05820 [Fibroporia radiculosa]|uniref:F-box domain-containing protein n=1 Tax=Fibroporia radiculosa TaxID=599839 RepID=J4IAX6_9APHY|nr:uncharacterized protein FIBRA_05820 [Fibroporia radiculosa]CCM03676.1 predicted protein [Fibroporia radiculosa]
MSNDVCCFLRARLRRLLALLTKFRTPAGPKSEPTEVPPLSLSSALVGSAGSRVSPELVFEVLRHYAHMDPSSMSAYSLTCRSWAEKIRRDRFRRVHIEHTYMHAFRDFIRHAPAVGGCVRDLTIKFGYDSSALRGLQEHEVVRDITSQMQGVRSLELVGYAVTPTTVASLASLTTTVENLSLKGIFSPKAEDIASFIRSFSVLKTLNIKDVMLSTVDGSVTGPMYPAARNQTAFAPVSSEERVRSNADICIDVLNGSHVGFWRGHYSAAYEYGSVLQGTGASVEHLIINIPSHQEFELKFNLAHCTRLRRVVFDATLMAESKYPPWIPAFLASVKTTSVRVITFCTNGNPRWLNWLKGIDAVLAHRDFRKLERVVFISYRPIDDFGNFTRGMLPKLNKRGLLVMEQESNVGIDRILEKFRQ